jgi:hypothetical protein
MLGSPLSGHYLKHDLSHLFQALLSNLTFLVPQPFWLLVGFSSLIGLLVRSVSKPDHWCLAVYVRCLGAECEVELSCGFGCCAPFCWHGARNTFHFSARSQRVLLTGQVRGPANKYPLWFAALHDH